MSGATVAARPDQHLTAPDSPPAPSAVEAGERGTLSIADRVVERVAGYAVTLVEDATAAPRRVLGVNVGGARPDDDARTRATVHGSIATVEATIAVRWPASVRSVAQQTRRRIREDVARVTGVDVDHVDIEVVSMDVPTATARRVR